MLEEHQTPGILPQAAAVFECMKTFAVLPAGRHSEHIAFMFGVPSNTYSQITPQDTGYLS